MLLCTKTTGGQERDTKQNTPLVVVVVVAVVVAPFFFCKNEPNVTRARPPMEGNQTRGKDQRHALHSAEGSQRNGNTISKKKTKKKLTDELRKRNAMLLVFCLVLGF